MYEALRARGVSAELHIFPEGGHGFGIAGARDKPAAVWPELFLAWGTGARHVHDVRRAISRGAGFGWLRRAATLSEARGEGMRQLALHAGAQPLRCNLNAFLSA